ncbi:MAG: hypothetical protein HC773_29325 [Scytonema sp. CRU_2_7]|nr:hypothetical protein [Scytonema sp. CRU_2_7]
MVAMGNAWAMEFTQEAALLIEENSYTLYSRCEFNVGSLVSLLVLR